MVLFKLRYILFCRFFVMIEVVQIYCNKYNVKLDL